jgi:TonB family protein
VGFRELLIPLEDLSRARGGCYVFRIPRLNSRIYEVRELMARIVKGCGVAILATLGSIAAAAERPAASERPPASELCDERVLHRPVDRYPPEALRRRSEGFVVVSADLDDEGNATNHGVSRGVTGILDRAAFDASLVTTFGPGQALTCKLVYEFWLSGSPPVQDTRAPIRYRED